MNTTSNNLAEAPVMYETENDLPKDSRSQLNGLMNQAHWNVKGPSFIALHELFDKVSEAVEDYVDMIAERIVQLGGIAEGTIRMAASRTRLPENSPEIDDGTAHVETVAHALSTYRK